MFTVAYAQKFEVVNEEEKMIIRLRLHSKRLLPDINNFQCNYTYA